MERVRVSEIKFRVRGRLFQEGVLSYLLILAGVLAWRLPLLSFSLHWDPSVYAYISRGILNGQIPYRDFFDNKPPVLYYSGALFLALLRDPTRAFWVQEAVFVFITGIAAWMLMRRRLGLARPVALGLALLLIFLSNVSLHCYFEPGFVEFPALMFTTLAYVLTLRARSPRGQALAGACTALAVLAQQVSFMACLPLWLWLAATRRWRALGAQWAAIGLLAAAFLAWFGAAGVLGDFWYCVVAYNRYYITGLGTSVDWDRLRFLIYLLGPLPLLAYLVPFGLRRGGAEYGLILGWLVAEVIGLALTCQRLFAHYFVPLAAPLTLALAYGWAARARQPRSRAWTLATAVSGALLVLLWLPAGRQYLSYARYYAHAAAPEADVIAFVRQYPFPPGARIIYVDGDRFACTLPLMTETRLPGSLTNLPHSFGINHPRREAMARQWQAEFMARPPRLIFHVKGENFGDFLSPELVAWIRRHYAPAGRFEHYEGLEFHS